MVSFHFYYIFYILCKSWALATIIVTQVTLEHMLIFSLYNYICWIEAHTTLVHVSPDI